MALKFDYVFPDILYEAFWRQPTDEAVRRQTLKYIVDDLKKNGSKYHIVDRERITKYLSQQTT